MMKAILTLLLAIALPALAQSAGQYRIDKKNAGNGYSAELVTPAANSLFAWNGSGAPTSVLMSAFETAGTAATVQAYAIQRANHTGTQAQSTIVNLVTDLAGKETAGAAATAQAFAIQRANHTGTQAQSTVTNLVTDLAAKQAGDADLTSWASITRASGYDAFAASATSVNLASLVSDETGTGNLLFGNQAVSTGSSPTFSALTVTNGAGFGNNITTAGSLIATQAVRADSYVTIQKTVSAPAVAANFVRLYVDGGGSGGKLRLMALFPTGAAQPVALEP